MAEGSAASRAVDPPYARLSIPEKIDRAVGAPSARAVLEGSTGPSTTRLVAEQGAPYGRHVMDFPFSIRAVYATRPAPYAVGSTITLRLPGQPGQPPPSRPGQPQPIVKEADGPEPPALEPGREYFVFARDTGIWAGGSSETVVVLTSPVDAFVVGADRLVRGQGPWASFSEPSDTFRRRVAR